MVYIRAGGALQVNTHGPPSAQAARRDARHTLRALGGNTDMTFSIPAAPILIPNGPWKEIDGCVCAPKGFRAQGKQRLCYKFPR